MKYRWLQILLWVVILFLLAGIIQSVVEPIRFSKEMEKRREVVIQKMNTIRTLQLAYRSAKGTYSESLDTLYHFYLTGRIPKTRILADRLDPTVSRVDTTGFVFVHDSILKNQTITLPDLYFIPFSGGKTYHLETAEVERSGIVIQVFQVVAPKEAFLNGLSNRQINNAKVTDLILGSLHEPSLQGNWE